MDDLSNRERPHVVSHTKREHVHGQTYRLGSKSLRIRTRVDYPWLVLDRLVADLAELMDKDDLERVTGIIRSRDAEQVYVLAADWSLQSMTSAFQTDQTQCLIRLQLGGLIKKFPFPGTSQERIDAALDKVKAGEEACSVFNRSHALSIYDPSGFASGFLYHAQIFCADVLGPLNEDRITKTCRHGPGSSLDTSQGRISCYNKFEKLPYEVPALAVVHAKRVICEDERWLGAVEETIREKFAIPRYCILDQEWFWTQVLKPVTSNRITTVPKDGKTDRPIAIEPTLGIYLQLGVDGFIRRRLKRWGIDMDTQCRNQYLAWLGSVSCHADRPATIDLSNASDTISLRLVKEFLPGDWYQYLCDLRAPKGTLPEGGCLRYSKLSSMGNGYTFAVETLLFAAVTYACSMLTFGSWRRDLISVFGDDIIIPETMAKQTARMLEACGFSLNTTKSFLQGTVKESCGTDWINGYNVRPVHLDKDPDNVMKLYAHRNTLTRWAALNFPELGGLAHIDELYKTWIPDHLYVEGPESDQEFSGYWHSNERGSYNRARSCYYFQCIVESPKRFSGENFLMRKLMNSLKKRRFDELEWMEASSAGSVYDVTQRKRVTHSMVSRRAPEWGSGYNSPAPTWPPVKGARRVWSVDHN